LLLVTVKWQKQLVNIYKRNRVGLIQSKEITHEMDRQVTSINELHTVAAGNLYMLCNHFGGTEEPQRLLLVFSPDLELVRQVEVMPEDPSQGG
jgi:hypothetical protein